MHAGFVSVKHGRKYYITASVQKLDHTLFSGLDF